MATVDPTVETLLTSTIDATEVVDPATYDAPADTTFDSPDALLTATVTSAAPAASTGPNWGLIGGLLGGGVVVVGLGVAGYMYFKK